MKYFPIKKYQEITKVSFNDESRQDKKTLMSFNIPSLSIKKQDIQFDFDINIPIEFKNEI